jgi:hypothetical protein
MNFLMCFETGLMNNFVKVRDKNLIMLTIEQVQHQNQVKPDIHKDITIVNQCTLKLRQSSKSFYL